MWQRIQSVFLGVTILSLALGLFLPILGVEEEITYRLYPIYLMIKQTGPNPVITPIYFPYCITAILMAAGLTIAIQEFRRFDNRMLQIKLGTLNSLILAGVMVCNVLFSNMMMKTYSLPWRYDYGLYLSFVAVVCNWIAIRFIRKDEKLVRDSDRIR